jgi:hypothetical protein
MPRIAAVDRSASSQHVELAVEARSQVREAKRAEPSGRQLDG